MPYTDAAAISAYLGRTFTADEEAQATVCATAASGLIDRYTGQTWVGTSIVAEQHTVFGPYVYLDRTPMTAISAVTARSLDIGAVPTTLAAGSDYELLDTSRGLLRVGVADRSLVAVSYTAPGTVPAEVGLAATMLAAHLLAKGPSDDGAFGLKAVRMGTFEVQYQNDPAPGAGSALPPEVAGLLSGYRRIVFA
jgi:hypothetical protein